MCAEGAEGAALSVPAGEEKISVTGVLARARDARSDVEARVAVLAPLPSWLRAQDLSDLYHSHQLQIPSPPNEAALTSGGGARPIFSARSHLSWDTEHDVSLTKRGTNSNHSRDESRWKQGRTRRCSQRHCAA